MRFVDQFAFERRLRRRIGSARRIAVVGVGDELSPHDRLGIVAAREIEGLHLPTVKVFLAGTVPESATGPVRKFRPDVIVFLDAADMGTRAGTVAIIQPGEIQARLFSTHALPLSVVMAYLAQETKAEVVLVGIQPDHDAHGDQPSALEEAGLTRILVSLHHITNPGRPRAKPVLRRSHAM